MPEPAAGAQASGLRCSGLCRFFGERVVLREVGFAVEPGRLIAVFGANGAGKSTLLRILAGGLRPSRGEASLDGERVGTAGARRHTGLLSHATMLHPNLTVRENLIFYAALFGVPEGAAAAAAALAQVHGEELAERHSGELSQGMRQKAALARCLLHRPRLLLLDEPFASLDVATVEDMRRCFAALREQGLTLLITSHNEAQVLDLADGTLRMERGRVAETRGAVRAVEAAHV